MKKNFLVLIIFVYACSVYGQNTQATDVMEGHNSVNVHGIVTDMKGDPIAGAAILNRTTDSSTSTDLHGNFYLEVMGNDDIIVSFAGYKTQIVPVNGKTELTVRLEENSLALETVVITAMGITRKEASLTYSTQLVDGNELTRAKDSNFMNSLAGKTSGVQIARSSSGLDGSVKVNIRGNRSITGNNQPLYVIDGVPMLNPSTEQINTIMGGVADSGNRDGGDGISNLNPEDIESINILKGASAAALYGSQAANGVILITTRKGQVGATRVTFSSNVTFDKATFLPNFQNQYAMDSDKTSWGERTEQGRFKDNVDGFFQGGLTSIHSISLSKGSESLQTYFSYANTYGKGLMKRHQLNKHNLNFRETASYFNQRLTLDGNLNLIHQRVKNRPVTGGYYANALVGLYGFPRGEDMDKYKTGFEVYDPERNMNVQNWYTRPTGFEQNPYWIINRIQSDETRIRTIAGLSATMKVNGWLNIQARGMADYICDKFNQKMFASTASDIAGTYYPEGSMVGYENGRYIQFNRSELLLYGDIMATFNRVWTDWTLNGAIGTSVNNTRIDEWRIDSKAASLYYPNVFTVANVVMNSNAHIDESINERHEIQSLFATVQLGWKDAVYLDVSGRNDWSSTLAFTQNKGYFYPSAGVSWIISNSLRLPSWISFGKVRGSWAQVGNDLPRFYSRLVDRIVAGGSIQANDRAPFDVLKPERSTSIEFGGEWKLFNQCVDLDFTFYKTNTRNQLLTLPSSAGAEYKYYMVNAGNIRNQGFEMTLGVTPIINTYFRWRSGINYAINRNKIMQLHPDLNSFIYGNEGFSMNYSMRLKEGGSFGDIYGWKFDRDENGTIKVDDKGLPLAIGSGNTEKVGNCNPGCLLGWSNSFSYKGFSLYMLIDTRLGGEVLSQTQAELDYRGVSANSGKARDRGYANVGGQRFTDVEGFYQLIGTRNNTVTEYYMYDADNIRLRELSLGYSLPRNMVEKTGVLQRVELSLIARNLFFFYKKPPFDPDVVMSTGNSCQGVDVFGTPTARSIGFNIKFML